MVRPLNRRLAEWPLRRLGESQPRHADSKALVPGEAAEGLPGPCDEGSRRHALEPLNRTEQQTQDGRLELGHANGQRVRRLRVWRLWQPDFPQGHQPWRKRRRPVRLATLKTENGTRAVSVVEVDGAVRYVDLSRVDPSLPYDVVGLLTQEDALQRAAEAERKGVEQGAFVDGRLLAPVPRPGKVFCIGLNYRDHAAESGKEVPDRPVVFSKFSQVVVGPEEPIRLPRTSEQVDYEAELVVVLGRRGKYISENEARTHVAGYMNGHDVSARDWQIGAPGGQWLLGKSADTFGPVGPWLVTADQVPDPHQLDIQLRLNGQVMQSSNTREMIFRIEQLIAYISQMVTLEPGDLIFTGTPPGVGFARKPPVYLKPGDVVEVEIQGLGVLRNPVVAE